MSAIGHAYCVRSMEQRSDRQHRNRRGSEDVGRSQEIDHIRQLGLGTKPKRRSHVALIKDLVAAALFLLVCPLAANAQQAEKDTDFFGSGFTLKFGGYAELGLEHISPRPEEDSSNFRISAYGEHKTKLGWGKNWAVKSIIKAEELDTRDDDDDEEGYGVILDSLFLQYQTSLYKVYAGKFQARFGVANFSNLGRYGYDFYDYEIDEKLGFGGSVKLGDGSAGRYVLSASLFKDDTTALSDSIFFKRGRLERGDGGPSNTDGLSSFAIAVDGEQVPGLGNNFQYHAAFARLDAGEGDESGSNSFVFGVRRKGWKVGEDAEVELVGEVAHVTNVDGDGEDITYYTFGATLYKGPFSLTSVYSPRFVSAENAADDRTEHLIALTLGYSLTDQSQLILGYRYRDEDNSTDNTVSLSIGFSY